MGKYTSKQKQECYTHLVEFLEKHSVEGKLQAQLVNAIKARVKDDRLMARDDSNLRVIISSYKLLYLIESNRCSTLKSESKIDECREFLGQMKEWISKLTDRLEEKRFSSEYVESMIDVLQTSVHMVCPSYEAYDFRDQDISMEDYLHSFNIKLSTDQEVVKKVSLMSQEEPSIMGSFDKPSELVAELDKYVIGQDTVKKAVAMHAFNHYKGTVMDETLKKENLLIVGETGTGKTYVVETMAKLLGKELRTLDVASLTSEGYVGTSLSEFIKGIVENMDPLHGLTNTIIFIDEFDKLASGLDVVAKVQDELLTLLEGKDKEITLGRRDSGTVPVSFREICIILGGAFTPVLEKKFKKSTKALGFKDKNAKADLVEGDIRIEHEDVVQHGIKRELVGRIGNIVQTNALSEDDLIRIITEPKECIKEYYNKMFDIHGITDKVKKKDVKAIITKANKLKLGARGLWAVAQTHFADRLYY